MHRAYPWRQATCSLALIASRIICVAIWRFSTARVHLCVWAARGTSREVDHLLMILQQCDGLPGHHWRHA
jgi:hypothetical protein